MRGIFIQGADVTAHVEAELKCQEAAAAAQQQRDRLNTLLDTVPAGMVARRTSMGPLPSVSRPETCDVRCITWL